MQVIHLDEGHLLALARADGAHEGDRPQNCNMLASQVFSDGGCGRNLQALYLVHHGLQGVLGKERAREFALPGDALLLGCGAGLLHGVQDGHARHGCAAHQVKHGQLAHLARGPFLLAHGHHGLNGLKQVFPFAEAVQRAGLDETLQALAVHLAQIHTLDEIAQVREGAAFLPRRHDGVDRPVADALDGAQPESDFPALNHEVADAVIHVGRQEFNPQPAGLGGDEGNLLGIAPLHAEEGRHVLQRVLGL